MTSQYKSSHTDILTSDGLVDVDGLYVGEVDGDSEVEGGNDGLVEGLVEGEYDLEVGVDSYSICSC